MDREYVDGVIASMDAQISGVDSMRWRPTELWDDNPAIPLARQWLGMSHAARAARVMHETGMDGHAAWWWTDGDARLVMALRPVVAVFNRWMETLIRWRPTFERLSAALAEMPVDDSPRGRALEARRTRNTGPADRRGLDGHHRRRTY